MAEEQSTSGQGRDLLLYTGEEFPEHVRLHSTAVGDDDDRDILNPLGNATSLSPTTNALGVSFTQNESPVPGPSFQAPIQNYSQHQYNQEAQTTSLEGSHFPQHITSSAMEGILDHNDCSYGESPHHRITDTEATHRSLEMAPLGPSYESATNHTQISPSGYDPSTHLVSTPFTTMNATSQTHHAPDHSTLPSMGRQETSSQEGNDGDDQPLGMSIASVDAEHMDIDEEGPGDTPQCLWDLAHDYAEAFFYDPLLGSLGYLPQADIQTNEAASQPGDPTAIFMDSSIALPTSANDQEVLGVPGSHSTTQAETEAMIEDVAINDLLGLESGPEPHSLAVLESFGIQSFLQDTNGLVFVAASQAQAPTSVEAGHPAGLAEGANLPLQQSNGALLSWSSQDGTQVPDVAPLPGSQANTAELGDLYDNDEEFERNHDVCEFFEYWRFRCEMKNPPIPMIGVGAMDLRRSRRPDEISIGDLEERYCDYQGIDWSALGAVREEARVLRISKYINYTNIQNRSSSAVSVDMNQ